MKHLFNGLYAPLGKIMQATNSQSQFKILLFIGGSFRNKPLIDHFITVSLWKYLDYDGLNIQCNVENIHNCNALIYHTKSIRFNQYNKK